jgi:DNA-binding NtrC family response regulator
MSLVPIKMLVADDSRTVQRFFEDVVAQSPLPIELLTAQSGRECMMFLEQGDIGLAFIDVHMPEMSGLEALGRARFNGNKTFVTLMSTRVDAPRFELARQLRVYEYLVKPFTADDVTGILKTYQRVTTKMRALIVDDSRTMRLLVRRVLERSIFRLEIEEASNGKSALTRFDHESFDIVFLDYNMPDLNGIETLEQVLARDPGTKVIMFSAERDDDHVRQAERLGASEFLYKPFFRTDVDRALHRALGLKMPGLASMASHHSMKRSLVCPSDPNEEMSEIHDMDGWSEVDAVAIGQAAKEPVASQ